MKISNMHQSTVLTCVDHPATALEVVYVLSKRLSSHDVDVGDTTIGLEDHVQRFPLDITYIAKEGLRAKFA